MESEEEIQDVVIQYFSNLFQASCVDGKLSERERVNLVTEEENMVLSAGITPEEVKNAVDSMYPEKSPGLDGLNPAFYQSYWTIVGKDVVEFCQKFMSTCSLPLGINRTLVCLIPKVKEPKDMTELRPISL